MILSFLKAAMLGGADAFNGAIGGPSRFTRAAVPDPAMSFHDDMSRRQAIAEAAEEELAGFMRDGVFFAEKPNSLGDACIWQGVYAAMCAMRWNVSPSPETQAAMLAAATALSRYFYPTGPSASILVRGAVPLALEHEFFQVDANNGAHYFTDGYLGPVYVYRDDASLDSLLGAMFGAAIIQRFGDAPSRAVLQTPLESFARNFERAGFRLQNRDGGNTRYGDCSPGFLQAPVRCLAAALPSLVSEGAVGSAWRAIAKSYGPEFARTDTQIPGKISYVNAHLAILATMTYVCAAPSGAPGLEAARAGLRTLMDKYADAGNSFLIYAAARLGVEPTQAQKDKADKILLEFPLGAKPRSGLNSSNAPALQPVPVWQRPPSDVIWQRSPYPYSGSEALAYTRLDYLIAHYFQRSA